jgi:acetolactate synthase-1/2/3 large subunit
MDVVKMFGPVTKWAISILHPDTIAEIIRKAVRLARTEKPGAVHIELPEDVAKMETDTVPLKPSRFRRSVPDDKIVDKAFDVIKNAKSPIILAGNGCIRKRASKQLRRLCEQTGIGVISTFMAKGSVDMDADYCHWASTWWSTTPICGIRAERKTLFTPTFYQRKLTQTIFPNSS